ncbi:DUF7007 domain-containing protein [Rhizobium leguminosarum]|uniref:DUF7007 domain-containing protein n=1 Tax=Rhizobium leguminosarum TaxID=384 RepID=UPI001AE5A055|nr:hypothetical protein [Rhizobium leguminosarum]MBP2449813.1 hypothetical protein [Rhizobium leguminosarum]
MSALATQPHDQPTPEDLGVEFGQSAEGFAVARIGDTVLAMLPRNEGGGLLASAWRVSKPLAELTRSDFYIYESTLANEVAFRERVFETAEHKRELRGLDRHDVRVHCNTPWGASQGATIYAEGIVSHSTADHGGIKLSTERNRLVHPMLRQNSGWYEEDVEWAIVALTFPRLFTAYEQKCADRTIRESIPDAWEAIHGRVLNAGESIEKDRRDFEKQHVGDWIVISAITSDHEKGFVEVVAVLGGNRRSEGRRFLVDSEEYAGRGRFGFVLDETRHCLYDGPSSFVGWNR